jgi:hypothetical protein
MNAVQTKIIVDINSVAEEIHLTLNAMIDSNILPNIEVDMEVCRRLVLAGLKDVISNGLNGVLKRTRANYLSEEAGKIVQVMLAKNTIPSVLEKTFKSEATKYLADPNHLRNIIRAYSEGGRAAVSELLRETNKYTVNGILDGIESSWHTFKHAKMYLLSEYNTYDDHTKMALAEMEDFDESMQGIRDNIVCTIEDLGYYWRTITAVYERIKGNPYDVWVIDVIPGNTAVITLLGDYRILRWEELEGNKT